MSVTLRNLSGDMSLWTSRDAAQSVLTKLTPEEFATENPGHTVPPGHIAANGVLKIEMVWDGGGWRIYSPTLNNGAWSAIANVSTRWFMPEAMAARCEAIGSNLIHEFMYSGAVETTTDNYGGRGYHYTPDNASVRIQPNHSTSTVVPALAAAGGLKQTWSGIGSVSGAPTDYGWHAIYIQGDAIAPTTPLVLYLFDIVEVQPTKKPNVFFTWDDGSEGHKEVADEMLATYGLNSTFYIIESLIDTANRLSMQDLRDMVIAGATLGCHGISGSWSAYSDAEITAEIDDWNAVVDAEKWQAAFKETLAYPGNDNYRKTTDGSWIRDITRISGLKLNRGNSNHGYGLALNVSGDNLNSMGMVSLGQTGTVINTAAHVEDLLDFINVSGLSASVMGHAIVAASPGSIDLTWAQFHDVMGAFSAEVALGESSRIASTDFIAHGQALGLLTPAELVTSNLLTDVFATPDYLDSLALSNEQPTSIDADYDANITSGVAHWAVWDKDSVPAVVDLAAIQSAVGAADSGSATITQTGAQTTITPTVTDTETVSYRFYIAWVSGTDESLIYFRSFGYRSALGFISDIVRPTIRDVITGCIN